MQTTIGYIVLYVPDSNLASKFWIDTFGFEIKKQATFNGHKVITVGALNSQTNFELVPLELMADNPDNLNLAHPSICLTTADLNLEHQRLSKLGIKTSEILKHGETNTFAVFDCFDNAYAIIEG